MPTGKKIKIQEITNFTFFDPKQKLFKVELSQMKPQKCIKFPKCSLNMPKIDQNVFYVLSFVLSRGFGDPYGRAGIRFVLGRLLDNLGQLA